MSNASVEKLNVGIINMTNISFDNIVMNFGFGSKEDKKSLLRNNADKKVYMDLSCFDPAEFYAEFPQLKGSFAALFCDEAKKIEVHYQEKSEAVTKKFLELGYTTIETSIISCGFIFPRTIVQIINEAYFALDEGVASKEDINRAMKYGVNYPKGPFEWSQGKEEYVKTLLNELLIKTGDQRYKASSLI
jgi:3-hydroxybutyryl-CoA dehydrogenase